MVDITPAEAEAEGLRHSAPPALFLHCKKIYDKMLEEAFKMTDDDGGSIIVYEGFLTHLVASLGLSTPYYTFSTRSLKDMGCIRQIRRGGGRSPSQWELVTSPTEALFFDSDPKFEAKEVLGRKGANAVLQGQINDLNKRVRLLETFVDALVVEEPPDE